ncbi:MAG TPA: ParA family protein [Acidisoma sp.]|nr:ParA family protein [Acidisoma sp.]
MDKLKVQVCLVSGHEWRASRTLPDYQTCVRCGFQTGVRNPLATAAPSPEEGSADFTQGATDNVQDIRFPTSLGGAEVEAAVPVELEAANQPLDTQTEAPFQADITKTIAVVSRKGGGGKSTLALHLAIAGHLRGLKTLIADTDPQCSASEVLKLRAGSGPKWAQIPARKVPAMQDFARRKGKDLLIVDTPSGGEDEINGIISLADLTLIAVRPTYLDIAAAVRTIERVRRLGRRAQLVITQAPSPRAGREMPAVLKTLEALRFTRIPVCPVVIHSRAVFQSALAEGRSAEERGRSPAADEVDALWRHVVNELASATSANVLPGAIAQ